VCLAEAGQQPGNVEAARRQQRSDPDTPAHDAAKLFYFLLRSVHSRQDAASPSSDRLSRLGWPDSSARALEQRGPKLLLDPPDLVRKRRLGDAQLLRGTREVAVPGHRLDGSQLPELHRNDRRRRSLP
jgi:hypothetical protein